MTKSLVVIGASSGIGRATARLAAERGYQVVLAARRRRRLDALRTAIKKTGGEATAATCDVTDPGAVNRMLQRAARRWDGVDAVVLTAGLGLAGAISSGRAQDWRRLFDTNVLGALNTARAAAPHLSRSRGDLVLLSSVAALHLPPRAGVYAASKAALATLAESLRRELIPEGIRVTLISPGAVDTEFKLLRHPPGREPGLGLPPSAPLRPEQVAEVVLTALAQPAEVNLSEIVVRSRTQIF